MAGALLPLLCGIGWAGENAPAREAASLLERPEALAGALSSRFGSGVRILRLAIYPDHAEVEAQDPREPSHVDRHTYDGESFERPEPVQVGRSRRRLNARLFLLADVDLALLPALSADALARAKTEEGRITNVLVERSDSYGESEAWGPPRIRVYVEGPRGGAFVEYGLDGKKKRVTCW
jgi:hypothetical protein